MRAMVKYLLIVTLLVMATVLLPAASADGETNSYLDVEVSHGDGNALNLDFSWVDGLDCKDDYKVSLRGYGPEPIAEESTSKTSLTLALTKDDFGEHRWLGYFASVYCGHRHVNEVGIYGTGQVPAEGDYSSRGGLLSLSVSPGLLGGPGGFDRDQASHSIASVPQGWVRITLDAELVSGYEAMWVPGTVNWIADCNVARRTCSYEIQSADDGSPVSVLEDADPDEPGFQMDLVGGQSSFSAIVHRPGISVMTYLFTMERADSCGSPATLDVEAAKTKAQFLRGLSLDRGEGNPEDCYEFTLDGRYTVGLGVRKPSGTVAMQLEDGNGLVAEANEKLWLDAVLPAGTYYVRVGAPDLDMDEEIEYRLRFGVNDPPPLVPSNLRKSGITDDAVTLDWDAPLGTTVYGYQVLVRYRDTDPQGFFRVLVEDTGTDNTTYTVEHLEPDKRYVFRVKAHVTEGLTQRSSYVRLRTKPAPQWDPPEVTVRIMDTLHDAVQLAWDIPALPKGMDVTLLYVSWANAETSGESTPVQWSRTPSGATVITYMGHLDSSTEYTFQLKARTDYGPWESQAITVTTLDEPSGG